MASVCDNVGDHLGVFAAVSKVESFDGSAIVGSGLGNLGDHRL